MGCRARILFLKLLTPGVQELLRGQDCQGNLQIPIVENLILYVTKIVQKL